MSDSEKAWNFLGSPSGLWSQTSRLSLSCELFLSQSQAVDLSLAN